MNEKLLRPIDGWMVVLVHTSQTDRLTLSLLKAPFPPLRVTGLSTVCIGGLLCSHIARSVGRS